MQILTVSDMKRWETFAEEYIGLSEETLMETAGMAVAGEILLRMKKKIGKAVVVCGMGNNGGDGFVCARFLRNAGVHTEVLLLGNPERLKGASAIYFQTLPLSGVNASTFRKAVDVLPSVFRADVIVDALIGTGFSGAVTEEKGNLIKMMNAAHGLRVAIDVPSGVAADTGEIPSVAVKADVTVALGAMKRAHVLSPAAEHCGDVVVADIGIPEKRGRKRPVFYVDRKRAVADLPKRDRRSHKGENGFVGIIAGSANMAGAGLLAAQGALYAGAGKVELLTTKSVARSLAGRIPEVMVRGVADGDAFSAADVETVLAAAEAYDVVVMGPGLSRAEGTQDFVEKILQKLAKPMVLDADALYAVAVRKMDLAQLPGKFVLTPHVGEFSRLTGLSAEETEAARIDVVANYAKTTKTTVVLKGAPTVTADCTGTAFVNSTGNPGMATGGMGDTLSGVIAALIGETKKRNPTPEDTVDAAVYLHGLAGDLLAKETPIGFTAGDVARKIPEAWALIEKE